MTPRRPGARALSTAAVLVLLAGACGGDEPSGTGDPVEGRAPTTEDTDGRPSTAPGDGRGPAEGPEAGDLADVVVTIREVARLDAPTKLVPRPGSDLLYVAEQAGRVVALEPDDDGLAEAATALDLTPVTRSGGEQGLLGLAFSPDGATLYVHHSGTDGETRVAAFAMAGDVADADSRTDLLTVPQPYANHNGGDIVVDADGLLWIGLGDGGSAGDPQDRAQDPDDLLGKILRIDPTAPSGDTPYGIPDGNPFAAGGGRPEVVVTGLRNPWRFRFDDATGDLWVADVGQDALEEISRLPADGILGANLGWSPYEGSRAHDGGREVRGGPPVGPVFEMEHGDGWCSVTGGPVYRGDRIPGLQGAYLFGDYCKPGLAALRLAAGPGTETAVLDGDVADLVSIDTDADGEVYLLSLDGRVSRLEPA